MIYKKIKIIAATSFLLSSALLLSQNYPFTIENHSSQSTQINIKYRINNAPQEETFNPIQLGSNGAINLNLPAGSCLTRVEINGVGQSLFPPGKLAPRNPCIEEAGIKILDGQKTTIDLKKVTSKPPVK